jgi:hypothetical protein
MKPERLMEVKAKCGQRHFKTPLYLIVIGRFPVRPMIVIISDSLAPACGNPVLGHLFFVAISLPSYNYYITF